jgi:hypothetical protein
LKTREEATNKTIELAFFLTQDLKRILRKNKPAVCRRKLENVMLRKISKTTKNNSEKLLGTRRTKL